MQNDDGAAKSERKSETPSLERKPANGRARKQHADGPATSGKTEHRREKAKANRKYFGRKKMRKRKSLSSPASAKKTSRATGVRTREARPYPAAPFEESLTLAEAIQKYASGERVRRLTLLKEMDKSPNSGPTKMLITNSGKYGLTTGSYAAEWFALTDLGKLASSPDAERQVKISAQFELAVANIQPFHILYNEYKNKKLPAHDVLKDVLRDGGVPEQHLAECVDTFIVNAKYLGLLQTIAGSEMLVPIEQVLEDGGGEKVTIASSKVSTTIVTEELTPKAKWSKTCFYISPIGDDDSEIRKHSNLFLSSIIEPALLEFGLEVVRADKIGQAGMITSQILEHVMRSKLVIADLSWHNPNAFYEMAIRHACKLPIIQICRRADKLPFDVNQVRTVVIDTTDIYTLIPRIETYRSEIASQARAALADSTASSNPLTVFFPGFEVSIPKER